MCKLDKDFQTILNWKKQLGFASSSTQFGTKKNKNKNDVWNLYVILCVLLSHIATGKGHVTL